MIRQVVIRVFRRITVFIYYAPMFCAKCQEVGRGLNYVKLRQGLPYFYGNIKIYLGDNITVHSRSSFTSSKVFDNPVFRVGDGTYLGPGLSIGVAKEISIGQSCFIASGVSVLDNDGHPLDPEKRRKGYPISKEDVSPVIIGDDVWIGEGAMILKGVTIGDRAIIGAKSVVTRKVQPLEIVIGNPAVTTKVMQF